MSERSTDSRASERLPLLHALDEPDGDPQTQQASSPQTRSRSTSPIRRIAPVLLIIPVAVIHRFTIGLCVTTTLRILQSIACEIWYHLNDPTAFPSGDIPYQSCTRPEVDQYCSAIISIMSCISSVGSIVAYSFATYLANRYGRRPVLSTMLAFYALSLSSFLAAQFTHGWTQLALLISTILCGVVGDERAFIFMITVYVLDTAKPEERTVWLSKIAGCAALGGALSTTIGGSITAHAHNTTTVYMVAILSLAVTFSYTLIVIPETFPLESRQQLLAGKRRSSSTQGDTEDPTESVTATALPKNLFGRLKSSLSIALEPFRILSPTYNMLTGKRNWRLVYCAAHIFVVSLAEGYAMVAAILYFSTQYMYTPAQTGYVLTLSTLAGTVALTVLVPFAVDMLKPLYNPKASTGCQASSSAEEERGIPSSSALTEDTETRTLQETADDPSKTSDHLDVHIAVASWFIEAMSYLLIAFLHSFFAQMAGECYIMQLPLHVC
ncbi:hypothetical protein CPC08DRAFT_816884 [Agrocybe pediades]|nr:hypothetical protein CPC08DRAFT_816884 [Agrocybe pediades]